MCDTLPGMLTDVQCVAMLVALYLSITLLTSWFLTDQPYLAYMGFFVAGIALSELCCECVIDPGSP